MTDLSILAFDALSFVLFGLYLIVQIIFYFYIEPNFVAYQGQRKKRNRKIPIFDDTPNSLYEGFSCFIEYGIFNKYSFFGYKNYVRGNLKILAVIFASIPITIIFYWSIRACTLIGLIGPKLLPLAPKDGLTLILGYWGFIISYFILERSHNYKKWEYLAGLYNSLISKDPIKDPKMYQYLKAALVLDLIEMEMWSHRSYYEIFQNLTEEHYIHYRDIWFPPNADREFIDIKEDLYRIGITKTQAIKIGLQAQQRIHESA